MTAGFLSRLDRCWISTTQPGIHEVCVMLGMHEGWMVCTRSLENQSFFSSASSSLKERVYSLQTFHDPITVIWLIIRPDGISRLANQVNLMKQPPKCRPRIITYPPLPTNLPLRAAPKKSLHNPDITAVIILSPHKQTLNSHISIAADVDPATEAIIWGKLPYIGSAIHFSIRWAGEAQLRILNLGI